MVADFGATNEKPLSGGKEMIKKMKSEDMRQRKDKNSQNNDKTGALNGENSGLDHSVDLTNCESESQIATNDLEYGTVHRNPPSDTPDSDHEDRRELSEKLGDAHLNILETKKLVICLGALSLGLFITFVDQTGVTVALAQIAKDLDAEATVNWAGSAALLANCVCQVLFGRLSDIFGRKTILLSSLGILAVAEICCGFAQTGVQFYIFRAFAGIGCGGTQSLTMVMLSDICSLERRGKYQGILGAQIGLGNALGPFIMAAFAERSSWRNFFHMMPGINVLVIITIYLLIDTKETSSNLNHVLKASDKFKKIDYLGMVFSTAALTLLLVPISGGGSTYAWDSSLIIVMFIIGGLCLITFVLIEWKVPKLPMIPIYLFSRRSLLLILGSNFFFGMAYYGCIYYLPYYFQIVHQLDSIHSAILLLPLVIPQSVGSIIAGQIITYTGRYIYVIITGYVLWTIGCGLLLLFNRTVSYGVVVVSLLIMGSGVGFTFQPTIVAAQAQSRKAERAVVISTRNVLRSFGGAMGIAVGSLIVSNSLLKEIDVQLKSPDLVLSSTYLTYLKTHIYSRIDITQFSPEQVVVIQGMYMTSIRNFFILCVPLIGICLVSTFFVKDRGLRCIDEV